MNSAAPIQQDFVPSDPSPAVQDPALAWDWAADQLPEISSRLRAASRAEDGLDEACRYHLQQPGKQFRAQLALSLCQGSRVKPTDALTLATICECFHNASLVHDDLQDRDLRRRDQESVWYRFGSAMAVSLGDHLLFTGYRLLGELVENTGRVGLVTAFSRGLDCAVRGQSWFCQPRPEQAIDAAALLTHYERQAQGKSGELLALPVTGALLLAGIPSGTVDRAHSVMRDYGLLYQCLDDLADITASKAGRAPGSDLRNGELTAPMIWYLSVCPGAQGRALLAFLADPDPQGGTHWMERLCNSPALEHGARYLQQVRSRIREGLAELPPDLAQLLGHALEQAVLR